MENRKEVTPEARESRRSAVKKMAYVAPIVLSLAASPAFARVGSGCDPNTGCNPS